MLNNKCTRTIQHINTSQQQSHSRARAAVHTGDALVTRHAVAVASRPADDAVALVVGHGVWVTSGGHLETLAVSAARLLEAVVNCKHTWNMHNQDTGNASINKMAHEK